MDTRKVTLVATIAVIALVAVGIGFAYTAATTNTENTVTPSYMALTLKSQPSEAAEAYSESFSGEVLYNTVTTYEEATEYLTFTFDSSQCDVTATVRGDLTPSKLVKIGDNTKGVYLNIDYVGGADDPFVVEVTNESGNSMSALYTFVIGYKAGDTKAHADEDTEKFVYFDPASGCTLYADNDDDKFTGGAASGVKVMVINLYVKEMTGSQKYPKETAAASLIKPMNNVTLKFTTDTVDETHTLTIPASFTNGTIVSSPVVSGPVAKGTAYELTITPSANYELSTFTLNNIDYKSKINWSEGVGTLIVTIDSTDITLAASFTAIPAP